jgi:hypothetical protein
LVATVGNQELLGHRAFAWVGLEALLLAMADRMVEKGVVLLEMNITAPEAAVVLEAILAPAALEAILAIAGAVAPAAPAAVDLAVRAGEPVLAAAAGLVF